MDLKSLQRSAKRLIDRRGGTDSLKDPGAKDPDTPAPPAERTAAPAPPKPGA